MTTTAFKSKQARRGIALGALLAPLSVWACRSTTTAHEAGNQNTTGGSSSDSASTDYSPVAVGSAFERTCSSNAQGISLPVTGATCTILATDGRVRANLQTTSGNPLLAVTYDGLTAGQLSTAGTGLTDVILSGPCPARAKDSPEPCTVELVELTRGNPPATGGQVEAGSSLTLRVSCPASLSYNGGDILGTTQQSPLRYEIHADNCAVY